MISLLRDVIILHIVATIYRSRVLLTVISASASYCYRMMLSRELLYQSMGTGPLRVSKGRSGICGAYTLFECVIPGIRSVGVGRCAYGMKICKLVGCNLTGEGQLHEMTHEK